MGLISLPLLCYVSAALFDATPCLHPLSVVQSFLVLSRGPGICHAVSSPFPALPPLPAACSPLYHSRCTPSLLFPVHHAGMPAPDIHYSQFSCCRLILLSALLSPANMQTMQCCHARCPVKCMRHSVPGKGTMFTTMHERKLSLLRSRVQSQPCGWASNLDLLWHNVAAVWHRTASALCTTMRGCL